MKEKYCMICMYCPREKSTERDNKLFSTEHIPKSNTRVIEIDVMWVRMPSKIDDYQYDTYEMLQAKC